MGRLQAMAVSVRRRARWARFAGVARALRRPAVMALAPMTADTFCGRAGVMPVASSAALVAGRIGAPRCFVVPMPPPVADHARIMESDGTLHPSLDNAALGFSRKQQAYLRMRGGLVSPTTGLVMPEFGAVLQKDSVRWLPEHRLLPGFVDITDDSLLVREDALHPAAEISRTVLVLCHAFHRNYGHWLFDCLPCLSPWLEHLRSGRLAVLVPPLRGNWQRRTLEMLQVPASAVIEASAESLLCADMIVPVTLIPVAERQRPQAQLPRSIALMTGEASASHALPKADIEVVGTVAALRAAADAVPHVERPERIYVSRRGLESFRTLQNEQDVEAAVARLGFAIIRRQDYSFDEQVALFSRARVIVGAHGGGLTNAVFAPAGCLVADILTDAWNTTWVLRLTQLFPHYYLPLMYPSDPEQSRPVMLGDVEIYQTRVFRVPVEDFTSALEKAMRALGLDRSAA